MEATESKTNDFLDSDISKADVLLKAKKLVKEKKTTEGAKKLKNLVDTNNYPSLEIEAKKYGVERSIDSSGHTILTYAIINMNKGAVRTLVSIGADVNQPGIKGFTPLMIVIRHSELTLTDKFALIDFLIKKGANVNLIVNNKTALLQALHKIYLEVRNENSIEMVHTAVLVMAILLEKYQADPNLTPNGEDHPIFSLIQLNNRNTFDIFMTSSHFTINLNVRNKRGYTCMGEALYEGHNDVISSLILYGADINEPVELETGVTPLMLACTKHKIILASLLIINQAKLNSQDNKGNTALIIACSLKQPSLVTLMLEYGADVNISNVNGDTAFDLVKKADNKELIDLLTEKTKIRVKKVRMLY